MFSLGGTGILYELLSLGVWGKFRTYNEGFKPLVVSGSISKTHSKQDE